MSSSTSRLLRLPLTANFHFIKNCNFRCSYCYATFLDIEGRPTLPDEQLFGLTRLLARTYTKVTLVGGEPTLYGQLPELLAIIKEEGALTNVVTNGSRIDATWLAKHAKKLDFLTVSVDSANPDTQRATGRATRGGHTLTATEYATLANAAHELGIHLKVNTVVTTANSTESLTDLILQMNPQRWKILQAAPVAGQNDEYIGYLTPPRDEFDAYLSRHVAELAGSGIRIVAEPIELIRGSYIMVDPLGRYFDSTVGSHTYSRSILDVGLEEAFADVNFDPVKFLTRGGDADWRT